MDLAYISDAFSNMTMRGPYSRYDNSWGPQWSQKEKGLTVAEKHRLANKQRKYEQKKHNQACHLCMENKRRKLCSYIRQKSQEDSSVIREEDEECAMHVEEGKTASKSAE